MLWGRSIHYHIIDILGIFLIFLYFDSLLTQLLVAAIWSIIFARFYDRYFGKEDLEDE